MTFTPAHLVAEWVSEADGRKLERLENGMLRVTDSFAGWFADAYTFAELWAILTTRRH